MAPAVNSPVPRLPESLDPLPVYGATGVDEGRGLGIGLISLMPLPGVGVVVAFEAGVDDEVGAVAEGVLEVVGVAEAVPEGVAEGLAVGDCGIMTSGGVVSFKVNANRAPSVAPWNGLPVAGSISNTIANVAPSAPGGVGSFGEASHDARSASVNPLADAHALHSGNKSVVPSVICVTRICAANPGVALRSMTAWSVIEVVSGCEMSTDRSQTYPEVCVPGAPGSNPQAGPVLSDQFEGELAGAICKWLPTCAEAVFAKPCSPCETSTRPASINTNVVMTRAECPKRERRRAVIMRTPR